MPRLVRNEWTNDTTIPGLPYVRRNRRTFIALAVAQLKLGISVTLIGVAAVLVCKGNTGCSNPAPPGTSYTFYFYGMLTLMGTDIWGGALVMLLAVYGLVQAQAPTKCRVVINFSLSIVGAILTPFFMTVEIVAAIASWRLLPLVGLHSTASVIFFVLFILFIVTASYAGYARGDCGNCFKGCCCDQKRQKVNAPHTGNRRTRGRARPHRRTQPHVVTVSRSQPGNSSARQLSGPSSRYKDEPPQYQDIKLNAQCGENASYDGGEDSWTITQSCAEPPRYDELEHEMHHGETDFGGAASS